MRGMPRALLVAQAFQVPSMLAEIPAVKEFDHLFDVRVDAVLGVKLRDGFGERPAAIEEDRAGRFFQRIDVALGNARALQAGGVEGADFVIA